MVYEPIPKVLVRSTLWPARLMRSVTPEILSNKDYLVEFYESLDPRIREALLIASPSLVSSLKTASPSNVTKIGFALLKYLIRLYTRPTPFGMFAGVGMADVAEKMELQLGPMSNHHCTITLSYSKVLEKAHELQCVPEIMRRLKYYINPTAYKSGNRIIWCTQERGRWRRMSVQSTPILERLLEMFPLPMGVPENVDEVALNSLRAYMKIGLVVSNLVPPITCSDPLEYLVQQITDIDTGNIPEIDSVKSYHKLFGDINSTRWGQRLEQINNAFGELGVSHNKPQGVLSVRMRISLSKSKVSSKVVAEAVKAAELLLRISPFSPRLPWIEAYQEEFVRRYGEKEVPLLKLLNEQSDLGAPPNYSNPEVRRPHKFRQGFVRSTPSRDITLATIASEALRSQSRVIRLTEDLICRLQVNPNWEDTAPPSLDVFVTVDSSSQDAINMGNFRLIIGPRVGTFPAGQAVVRYLDHGKELGPWKASQRGVVCCEPIWDFGPNNSANQVLLRPRSQNFQIPVTSIDLSDPENVIPLNDIVVGVSSNRFYLWSVSRNQQVIVSNMNLLRSDLVPNIVRFLHEISNDGVLPITGFDWGNVASLSFLPRIEYGKSVLSLARWRFIPYQKEDIVSELMQWIERWRIPDEVYIWEEESQTDGYCEYTPTYHDQRLYLDLRSKSHFDLLVSEARKAARRNSCLVFEEALPSPSSSWMIDSDNDAVVSELVISMTRSSEIQAHGRQSRSFSGSSTFQVVKHTPGGEWLYWKLYSLVVDQDFIIRKVCEPLRQWPDILWFFLRFEDPDPHLRLRVKGNPEFLQSYVFPELNRLINSLVEDGSILRVVIDTYEPELDRFGGILGLETAERIFWADSCFVAATLELLSRVGCRMNRQELALYTSDRLAKSLGLQPRERLEIYSARFQRLISEYKVSRSTFAKVFRSQNLRCDRPLSGGIQSLLTNPQFRDNQSRWTDELSRLIRGTGARRILESRAIDFLHLHLNRLGIPRSREAFIFYALSRIEQFAISSYDENAHQDLM